MAKTAYLNTRLEPELKSKAEHIFAEMGISTAAAVTMFFRQVTLRGGLPFDVCIPNAETKAALAELDAPAGRVYSGTGAQVLEDILRE